MSVAQAFFGSPLLTWERLAGAKNCKMARNYSMQGNKGQSPFKLLRKGAILFLKYTYKIIFPRWKNIERSRNVKRHKPSLIKFALDSINTTLWVRNKSYALINKKWYIVVTKKWGNWQQLWSETIFRWKYFNDQSLQGRVWRVVTVSKTVNQWYEIFRITFAGWACFSKG